MGEVQVYGTVYEDYAAFKKDTDVDFRQAGESIVRIGYKMKLARDTEILRQSGYANVNEWARAEYGLDKSQVSRFIRVNDRFSENGYSDRLKERYEAMGSSKLILMLSLPDAVNEELSPAYSKSEIQAIKEEVEEEEKVTDIEVILEGQDPKQQAMGSMMERVVHQLLKDEPETFREFYRVVHQGKDRKQMLKKIFEVLAPNGDGIKSVKIKGVARFFLSIKGREQDLTLVNVRSEAVEETCTWEDLLHLAVRRMGDHASEREAWEAAYGEPYPATEEPKVAPVQPEGKKPAQRKVSRFTKAKVEKVEGPPREEPVQQAREEQLPGQTEITDFIEVPGDTEPGEDGEGTQEPEGTSEDAAGAGPGETAEGAREGAAPQDAGKEKEGTQTAALPPELARQRRKEYETAVHLAAEELLRYVDIGTYDVARERLLVISRFLQRLEELPPAENMGGGGPDEKHHTE